MTARNVASGLAALALLAVPMLLMLPGALLAFVVLRASARSSGRKARKGV